MANKFSIVLCAEHTTILEKHKHIEGDEEEEIGKNAFWRKKKHTLQLYRRIKMKREKTFDCTMDRRWRWCAWDICNIDVCCCCCCSCCCGGGGRCCAICTRVKPCCYTNTIQLTRIHIAWKMTPKRHSRIIFRKSWSKWELSSTNSISND